MHVHTCKHTHFTSIPLPAVSAIFCYILHTYILTHTNTHTHTHTQAIVEPLANPCQDGQSDEVTKAGSDWRGNVVWVDARFLGTHDDPHHDYACSTKQKRDRSGSGQLHRGHESSKMIS